MKTKEKILKKAIELFNRKGVEQVTTLYISKEMGISLGNLHYHYPNRDAVIRALIDQFLSEMEILSAGQVKEIPLNFMEKAFRDQFIMFREMWKYRFLFADRLVISRRMDYLEEHFKVMLVKRKKDFDATLAELKQLGMIRPDLSREMEEVHFQQQVIWNNSWIAYHDLFEYDGPPYLYFAEQSVWGWKPYLTCTDKEMRCSIARIKEELAGV